MFCCRMLGVAVRLPKPDQIPGSIKEGMYMAFKVLFLVHAPDGDPGKHRSVIETSKYKLITVVVKTQDQAVEECKKLVAEEGIHSVLLCPGFTHEDVSQIADTVGKEVAVAVARGDGPSNRVSATVRMSESWVSDKRKD